MVFLITGMRMFQWCLNMEVYESVLQALLALSLLITDGNNKIIIIIVIIIIIIIIIIINRLSMLVCCWLL